MKSLWETPLSCEIKHPQTVRVSRRPGGADPGFACYPELCSWLIPGSWECEWWSCRLLEPPFPAGDCLWGKPTPGAGICWPLPQSAGVSATPDRGEGPAVNWEPDPGLDVNPPALQSVRMWGASSRLRQITKCHFSRALHSWVLLLLPAGQPAAAPQHLPAQPHLSAPASQCPPWCCAWPPAPGLSVPSGAGAKRPLEPCVRP